MAATPDVQYDYYYNHQWQVVEVRKDNDTDPLEQWLWHDYYIDAPAVRYYDDNVDGASVALQYFAHDANFNITALVDSAGAVQERYEYDPYGAATVLDANFANDANGVSDYLNTVTYCGYRFDAETGLYHVRNRYLDPGLGRWVTRDPIVYLGRSLSLYDYIESRVLKRTDPFGLEENAGWLEKIDACLRGGGLDAAAGDECRKKYWWLRGNNDPNDAIRHCAWNCCMAFNMPTQDAKDIADNHEDWNPNDPEEEKMDKDNNRVGRQLGDTLKARGDKHTSCLEACGRAMRDGRLRVIRDKTGKLDPWDRGRNTTRDDLRELGKNQGAKDPPFPVKNPTNWIGNKQNWPPQPSDDWPIDN